MGEKVAKKGTLTSLTTADLLKIGSSTMALGALTRLKPPEQSLKRSPTIAKSKSGPSFLPPLTQPTPYQSVEHPDVVSSFPSCKRIPMLSILPNKTQEAKYMSSLDS